MVEAEQQEIDDELEEIKRLIDDKDAANTKRITKLVYNVFSSVVDVATAEKDLASLDKHVARVSVYIIYRPSALGIGRNISFSNDISLGLKPSGNITSGNIWPNPPRSGSINDKYTIVHYGFQPTIAVVYCSTLRLPADEVYYS